MNKDFSYILDTFSGADGGVAFVAIKALIEQAEKEVAEGKESTKELLQIV